jgi:hypothetical protein
MNVVRKMSLGYAKIIIYDNGIFHVHFLDKISVDLEQIKQINDLRESFFITSKALVLSTSEDEFVLPTPEAMQYARSADRNEMIKAEAYVIKSFSQRLFMVSSKDSNKTSTPTSYFDSEEKAIEWLLSIKD